MRPGDGSACPHVKKGLDSTLAIHPRLTLAEPCPRGVLYSGRRGPDVPGWMDSVASVAAGARERGIESSLDATRYHVTDNKKLKARVRERMKKTGESYQAALRHVRAKVKARPADARAATPEPKVLDLMRLGYACGVARTGNPRLDLVRYADALRADDVERLACLMYAGRDCEFSWTILNLSRFECRLKLAEKGAHLPRYLACGLACAVLHGFDPTAPRADWAERIESVPESRRDFAESFLWQVRHDPRNCEVIGFSSGDELSLLYILANGRWWRLGKGEPVNTGLLYESDPSAPGDGVDAVRGELPVLIGKTAPKGLPSIERALLAAKYRMTEYTFRRSTPATPEVMPP